MNWSTLILFSSLVFPTIALAHTVEFSGLTTLTKEKILTNLPVLSENNISKNQALDAAKQLENILEKNGFFLAEVVLDETLFEKGKVHFDVYEGFISEIYYDNEEIISQQAVDKVASIINRITSFNPIHRDQYEKYILLAEEMAGVDLEAFLLKSNTVGAADARIKFKRFNRLDAFVSADNHLNKGNGPIQYSGGVILNTPEWNAQTTLIAGTASKDKRTRFLNASYGQVLGTEGFTSTLLYNRSQAQPNPKTTSVSRLDSSGLGVELAYPSYRSLRESLIYKATLEGVKSKNRSTNNLENYEDRINSLRLNAHYEFFDRYYARVIWHAQLSQGLKIFSASDNAIGRRSREGARSDYTKLNLSFNRMHYLPNNFSWLLHVFGQYGFHKMVSTEEFDIGGGIIGRGYEEARLSGDSGAAVKLELHRLWRPELWLEEVDTYAFYDFGAAFNKAEKINLNGENRVNASASSVGLGLNTVASKYFKTQLIVGKPLTYPGRYGLKIDFKITFNLNQG